MRGRPESAVDRFAARIADDEGCWIWTGALNASGYGTFNPDRNKVYAHRWSYEHHVSPIPDGLDLDHLCRTPSCVNPWHLEPVTRRVNQRRGDTFAATYAATTHCVNGHAFDEANTYFRPDNGHRKCRACNTDRQRAATAAREHQPNPIRKEPHRS